ncbi:MAG: bifunctional 4-hydroxy-2-oxoglutarate aldolase/2-dehydro-3-deoxy-phosphogluconate aldolase [Spirochaetota bacterium]|nr:bifunctional 4-hydroxy-2-oxoglutarate aldolase/2-dehydro-3-deoxy-phosphogluconate aldolase [Spirochaetota bacterium]
MNILEVFGENKIIPVAILNNEDEAIKTAEVLLQNSIKIIEIALRTDNAFRCIEKLNQRFPELIVGAGSVLSKDALTRAVDAGVKFGVAPCLDLDVMDHASNINIDFIPGISTPSELNLSLKLGSKLIKLFPASPLGGVKYIKAIISPFKMMDFSLFPTGGINENNILDFIQTDRVIACGLTYIVDSSLISKGDYDEVYKRIIKLKDTLSI